MPKYALCCNMADLPPAYQNETELSLLALYPGFFDNLSTTKLDRADCETQEEFQQLLPYIVLRDQDTGKIFTYSRGAAGGEARLVGNLSVGLGGHIDARAPDHMGLEEWCIAEAHRELAEEAGITQDLPITFVGIIRDPTNAVGRVHMGILAIVDVPSTIVATLEAGVIERGEWLAPGVLHEHHVDQLENWSKLVSFLLNSNSLFLAGESDKFSVILSSKRQA